MCIAALFLDRTAYFTKSGSGRRFFCTLPERSGINDSGVFMVIYLKLFLTAIFWGGTFVAARIVAQHVGPYSASFLRFLTASIFLIVMITLKEGRIPRLERHPVLPFILLGMTGVFAYNIFFFLGMKTISAGRASLIAATNPVFISLLSALLFGERLNSAKVRVSSCAWPVR